MKRLSIAWTARAAIVTVLLTFALPVSAQTLRVLVTNDDGVDAPGIDALVNALVANANLDVTVIAPDSNMSGSGDQITLTNITVTDTTTFSGYPAKAVGGGFPADTVIFAVLQELVGTLPELVVSGTNLGQNMPGDVIPASGTVGAANWAARLGIPAIAVSASLNPNYVAAATYVAAIVEKFRTTNGFRKKMKEASPPFHGVVLNINYPTCFMAMGTVRGAKIVAVGRRTNITGYTLQSDIGGVQTYQVDSTVGNFQSNCLSTLETPVTDLEAWNNGFVAVSPLVSDRSLAGRKLKQFKFLEKLF